MRHLGNLAAHAAYSVYFECLFCDVSWQGCAAAADCPVCGAGYDWNNPIAGPSWWFPHPWDLKWIWRFGDRAGPEAVGAGNGDDVTGEGAKAMSTRTYEELQKKVRQLQASGEIAKTLSSEEKIDWAYGNTVIENSDITLDMVEAAYISKHPAE